jgi:hypothetical protein
MLGVPPSHVIAAALWTTQLRYAYKSPERSSALRVHREANKDGEDKCGLQRPEAPNAVSAAKGKAFKPRGSIVA